MRGLDPKVREHLAPARGPLVLVLAGGGLQALLIIAQAALLTGALDAVVRGDQSGGWAAAVAVVFLGRAVVSVISDAASASAAARVAQRLRERILQALAVTEPGPDGDVSTGPASLLATRGVDATKPYLVRFVPAWVLAATVPILSVVAITVADPWTGLEVMLTLLLVPLFAALIGMQTRVRADHQWRQLGSLAGHFMDVVRGLPTLVVFRRADRQVGVIRAITHRYRRASLATLRLAFASAAVLELVATLSVALVAVTVGLRLAAGHLDLGTALFVLLLAPEAYWPLRRAGAEYHAAAEGMAAFTEASALLDRMRMPRRGSHALTSEHPVVTLDQVCVRWPQSDGVGLAPTTLRLPERGLVAVRGPSGAGKTTMLAAIRGAVDVTTGSVRVDGVALGDLDADLWRSRIAWLPQRPVFVAGSVADNLRLARPEATDAELWQAVAAVGLDDRVSTLPRGLDGAVEQDGLNFSAGERARLALARVLVARRPILLLDEPSAHVDVATEEALTSVLREVSTAALVVVVTHRDTLPARADLIVTLEPARGFESARQATTPAPRDPGPATSPRTSPPSDSVTDPDDDEPARPTHRWRSAASIGLSVLASLAGIALTAMAGWLIVEASEQPPVLTLTVAIVGVRTFGLARPCLRYVERLWSHDLALRVLADRRANVFAALIPLTPGRLGRRRGALLGEVVDDVEAYVDRRLRVWHPLADAMLTGLVVGLVVVVWQPAFGIVDLLLMTAVAGVAALVAGAVAAPTARAAAAQHELGDQVTDLVETRQELAWWSAHRVAVDVAVRTGVRLEGEYRRQAVVAASARGVLLAVTGIAVAYTLHLAAHAVTSDAVTPSLAGLLVLLPLAVGELVQSTPDAARDEVRTRHALRRLAEVTSRRPLVTDPPRPVALPNDVAGLTLSAVSAGWTNVPAIRDVSAGWSAGARVGVAGPTGSGKSTLAGLLVRFLDPMAGTVEYSDVPLTAACVEDVRRLLVLLDDDPHLFATTIGANVRLAEPTASDDDVARALRAAGLGDWLASMPDGLATLVGEGNRDVSGGERARLGAARILLSRAKVVVLDEPTAHLDAAAARTLLMEIDRNAGTRTVVTVSHRAADLERCDTVLRLGDGNATGEAVSSLATTIQSLPP